MREDISHMMLMPEGERRFRVFPTHWHGGYYEVAASPGSADIIVCIHSHNWQERSERIQQRIWTPRKRKVR